MDNNNITPRPSHLNYWQIRKAVAVGKIRFADKIAYFDFAANRKSFELNG